MNIYRTPSKFEPITIVLESQEDVNAMFNLAILAGEHEEAESTGSYEYASTVAAALQAHITTEEVDPSSVENDDEEVEEIPEGN